MGIFEDIFGGGNTNSSSSSTSTPSNFNPFTSALAPAITGMAGTGAPQYSGPLYAGITTPEQTTLDQLGTMAGPNTSGSNFINSVLQGNYMPGGPNGNPFLQDAITAAQRPTMQNLQETLDRSLPGRFTANGQMVQPGGSSAFDRAAAIATRGATQAMSDIATNMSASAYNTGVQQMTAAVPLQMQEVQTTIQTLQAQALPRLIQQLGIQNGLSAFQENSQALLTFLNTIASAARPDLGNTSSSSSTGMGNTETGIVPDATGAFKAAFPAKSG